MVWRETPYSRAMKVSASPDERGGLLPFPGKNKIFERLARARRKLPRAKVLRDCVCRSGIPERDGRDRLPILGNREELAGFLHGETGHLMDSQAQCGGFDNETHCCLASIMERMPIGLAGLFEIAFAGLFVARPGTVRFASARRRYNSLLRGATQTHGFWAGRRSTSLMKLCGAWVRSISTACATSSGWSIFAESFPVWGENSVATVPGQMTLTRMPWPRSSSARQ